MGWKNICIFGDSITQGYFDTEHGGWVNRLFTHALDRGDIGIFNLGISGDTTDGLLKRLEGESSPREPHALVFSIGINDAASRQDKSVDVSDGQFAENIRTLLEQALRITNQVAFIGLTRVDEMKTNPLPDSLSGKCYRNARIDILDSTIERLCADRNVPYLSMKDAVMVDEFPDGLHPGAHAHQVMFERVKDFLEREGLL